MRGCELRTGALLTRPMPSLPLWQAGEQGGGAGVESPAFIERLRARLGDVAVHGVQMVADHRPEAAWRSVEPGTRAGDLPGGVVSGTTKSVPPGANVSRGVCQWPAFTRPPWLLSVPRLLRERAGLLRLRGASWACSRDPERIESGWWDGAEVARDYYVAIDARGARLWVFRERAEPHRWFLHGVFG